MDIWHEPLQTLVHWDPEMQHVTVASLTLFDVAAHYLGDATLWTQIAALNGIADPWLQGLVSLDVPDASAAVGGVFVQR